MKRTLIAVVLGFTALGTAPTYADPPPTIVVPDGVFAATVTATISPTSYRFAHAVCEQTIDGVTVVVYEQWVTIVDGAATFQLGPTALWAGGDAECVGDVGLLHQGKWRAVASDGFHVDG